MKNLRVLVLVMIFLIYGCATNRNSIEPYEALENKAAAYTHDENPTYAVFRGTGNTVCGFLLELELKNSNAHSKLCENGTDKTYTLVLGEQIPTLDNWDTSPVGKNVKILLTDPQSGKPFPKGTIFHFPGEKGFISEGFRVISETIVTVNDDDGRFDDLVGNHITYAYCHSNGCTQAQYAALKKYITIDNLYHLGSPRSLGPHDIDQTRHAMFSMLEDPVWLPGFWQFVKLIPEVVGSAIRSRAGDKFQTPYAVSHVTLEAPDGQKGGHAMVKYYLALNEWFASLRKLTGNEIESRLSNKVREKYKVSDLADHTVRATFSKYFNVAEHPSGYLNFNIQKGLQKCTETSNDDCSDRYYVNHRYAQHWFNEKTHFSRKLHNSFVSIEKAKACINKIATLNFEKKLQNKTFKICKT